MNMKLPERTSLTTETVKVLCSMISAGELKQRLPGERDLATRLQIGRDTLRAALVELEKLGWISVGEHGKRRKILKKPKGGGLAKRTGRIGFLSPKRLQDLTPAMLLEVDHLREILARQDVSLEVHSPSISSLQRPGSRLKDLVGSVECDAWILHQATEQVQSWFQKQKTPCLIRGHPHAGVDLPCLDIDWQATGYHAGALLTRNGHRSLGLMMPDTQLQGLFASQKGLEMALNKTPEPTTLHTITEHRTINDVALALHRAFQGEHPPTAIVATRSRQVLTLISWLASHRLNIPHNLSLVSLTYDNVLDALVPRVSYYHLDPSTMARNMARKLDSVMNRSDSEQKKLIPEFFPGQSVKELNI
jgi:LacI family transcriptional regulator